MKDDDDDEDESLGATRLPVMPSLVALQQMRNRLHLAQLGKKLMKWTAQATLRELRRISEDLAKAFDGFREDTRNAYILLARARYHEPQVNPTVLNNPETSAAVSVRYKPKSVAGVKIFLLEVIEAYEEPYPHLGLGHGGQSIADAKIAWRELLKKILAIVELRKSFIDVYAANKNSTKRANIIKKIVIPRIQVTTIYINSELEEKEREDTFRLKQFKKIKDKKKKKAELAAIPEGDKELVVQQQLQCCGRVTKPPETIPHPATPIPMMPCCREAIGDVSNAIGSSKAFTSPMPPVKPPCKKVATPPAPSPRVATPSAPCTPTSKMSNIDAPCTGPCSTEIDPHNVFKLTSDQFGTFEKEFKQIIKVTRTLNSDGTVTEEEKVITIRTERRNPQKNVVTSSESKHSTGDSCCKRHQGPRRTKSENCYNSKCMAEPTIRTCMSVSSNKSGENTNDPSSCDTKELIALRSPSCVCSGLNETEPLEQNIPTDTCPGPGATCACWQDKIEPLKTATVTIAEQRSCPEPGLTCGCWPKHDTSIGSTPVQRSCPLPGSTCGCRPKHDTSIGSIPAATVTIAEQRSCPEPGLTCGCWPKHDTAIGSIPVQRSCPLPGSTCGCRPKHDTSIGSIPAATVTIAEQRSCPEPGLTCGCWPKHDTSIGSTPVQRSCPLPGSTCGCRPKHDTSIGSIPAATVTIAEQRSCPEPGLTCGCWPKHDTSIGSIPVQRSCPLPGSTCGCRPKHDTSIGSIPVQRSCPLPGSTCGCRSKHDTSSSIVGSFKASPPLTSKKCPSCSNSSAIYSAGKSSKSQTPPISVLEPGICKICKKANFSPSCVCSSSNIQAFSPLPSCTCSSSKSQVSTVGKTSKNPSITEIDVFEPGICKTCKKAKSGSNNQTLSSKPSPAHTCGKTASQIGSETPTCTCSSSKTQTLSSLPPCTCSSSKTQVGTVCKAPKAPIISVFEPGVCKTCKKAKSGSNNQTLSSKPSPAHTCGKTASQIGSETPTCTCSSSKTQTLSSLPPCTCSSSKTQVGTVCKAPKAPVISVFEPGVCKTCKKAKSGSNNQTQSSNPSPAHTCGKTASEIGSETPTCTCSSSKTQTLSSLPPCTCSSSKTQVGTVCKAPKAPIISVFEPGVCKTCKKAKSGSNNQTLSSKPSPAHTCGKTASQIGSETPTCTCSSSKTQTLSSLPPCTCSSSKTQVGTVCKAPKAPLISVFESEVCKACKQAKTSPAHTCGKTASQIGSETPTCTCSSSKTQTLSSLPPCTCSSSKTQVGTVCKAPKAPIISVFEPGVCKTCKKTTSGSNNQTLSSKSSPAHTCGKTASQIGSETPTCTCSSSKTQTLSSLPPCTCSSSKTQVGTVCKAPKTPLISVFESEVCKACKQAKTSPAHTCGKTASQIGSKTPTCTCSSSKTQTLSSLPPCTCSSSKTQVGTVCKAPKAPIISVFEPGVCKTCKKTTSGSNNQTISSKPSPAHTCGKTASQIGYEIPTCTCSSSKTQTLSSLPPCTCSSSKTQVGTVCKAPKAPLISVFESEFCKACKQAKTSPAHTCGKTASQIGSETPTCTCSSSKTQTLSSLPPCTCSSSKTQVGTVCKAPKAPIISVFEPGVCKTCKKAKSGSNNQTLSSKPSPAHTCGKTASQIGSETPTCTCSSSKTKTLPSSIDNFTQWVGALCKNAFTSTTCLVGSIPNETKSEPVASYKSSCGVNSATTLNKTKSESKAISKSCCGEECVSRMSPELKEIYKAICSLIICKSKSHDKESLPGCLSEGLQKSTETKKACKFYVTNENNSGIDDSLDGSCKQCQASIESEEEISISESLGSSLTSANTCKSTGIGTCSTKSSISNRHPIDKISRNCDTPKTCPSHTATKASLKKPYSPVVTPKSKTPLKTHFCSKSTDTLQNYSPLSDSYCSCESNQNANTSTKKSATFDMGSTCSNSPCSTGTVTREASASRSEPGLCNSKLCWSRPRSCMSESGNKYYYYK